MLQLEAKLTHGIGKWTVLVFLGVANALLHVPIALPTVVRVGLQITVSSSWLLMTIVLLHYMKRTSHESDEEWRNFRFVLVVFYLCALLMICGTTLLMVAFTLLEWNRRFFGALMDIGGCLACVGIAVSLLTLLIFFAFGIILGIRQYR